MELIGNWPLAAVLLGVVGVAGFVALTGMKEEDARRAKARQLKRLAHAVYPRQQG